MIIPRNGDLLTKTGYDSWDDPKSSIHWSWANRNHHVMNHGVKYDKLGDSGSILGMGKKRCEWVLTHCEEFVSRKAELYTLAAQNCVEALMIVLGCGIWVQIEGADKKISPMAGSSSVTRKNPPVICCSLLWCTTDGPSTGSSKVYCTIFKHGSKLLSSQRVYTVGSYQQEKTILLLIGTDVIGQQNPEDIHIWSRFLISINTYIAWWTLHFEGSFGFHEKAFGYCLCQVTRMVQRPNQISRFWNSQMFGDLLHSVASLWHTSGYFTSCNRAIQYANSNRKKYPRASEWSLLESSHENVSCQMLDILGKTVIYPTHLGMVSLYHL